MKGREPDSSGMMVIDYFAAHAPDKVPDTFRPEMLTAELLIKRAVLWRWEYADMMIKERNRR